MSVNLLLLCAFVTTMRPWNCLMRPIGKRDAVHWEENFAIAYLAIGKQLELRLMDLKEAVQAAAPAYDSLVAPEDHAQRVVEGARHLSPFLGERIRAVQLFGRSIFIREILPQSLKIELATDATALKRLQDILRAR